MKAWNYEQAIADGTSARDRQRGKNSETVLVDGVQVKLFAVFPNTLDPGGAKAGAFNTELEALLIKYGALARHGKSDFANLAIPKPVDWDQRIVDATGEGS